MTAPAVTRGRRLERCEAQVMIVTITLANDPDRDADGWDANRVLATAEFPAVRFSGFGGAVVEAVKGAVLCCIGEWEHVPDEIRFEVKDARTDAAMPKPKGQDGHG